MLATSDDLCWIIKHVNKSDVLFQSWNADLLVPLAAIELTGRPFCTRSYMRRVDSNGINQSQIAIHNASIVGQHWLGERNQTYLWPAQIVTGLSHLPSVSCSHQHNTWFTCLLCWCGWPAKGREIQWWTSVNIICTVKFSKSDWMRKWLKQAIPEYDPT